MNFLTLMMISGVIFLLAYRIYGRFLERELKVDPNRVTPAVEVNDGVEYVPAKKPVLLGHHFATIAGGGPITGPITAVAFGWLPAVLWIIIGSIFIGGVHDYTSLQASIRHKAKSIGAVIKEYMGGRGQILFLTFSIATLILVVGVFMILVANTFVSVPEAATASILFLGVAIIFGFFVNQLRVNLAIASVFGVIAMLLSIWVGINFPIHLSAPTWSLILLGYAYAASVMPVWLLLQPRDYLNAFLLYGLIIGAVVGILIAAPSIQLPAYTGFRHETMGFLFPILFITIACGAISGFHSLVSSGTTAKQLDNEKNGKFIAYGGMLLEGFLAIIAIGSVAYLSQADFAARMDALGGPIGTFAAGIGYFMSFWGISETVAVTFAALTASAFLLTTLDSATRLMRYAVQEITEDRAPKAFQNSHVATASGLVFAAALALSGTWSQIWPLFGSANQMLGALALLAVAVWLKKTGARTFYVVIPMYFMFFVTVAALGVLMYNNFIASNWLLFVSAFILFILCIFLAIEGWRALGEKEEQDRTVKM
ncbi:carbon starvation protein A [Alkalihalophilus marmarensis]|jgi:carbon starvation protein|uniref:Carbon starvation protein CstA n=1 Tax=Alkalihalophilus marmarensis DSM 21297 TaxID=1188261 RepID=U6SV24_9BACI|nr:carbon starvation protein A [Alkalihalophilus marmarensis]ERN54496.1 carbon starvation protein CstA [Alkalihalophilus marmarensis DSM 21297]MCM3490539.1 carbon starvation protein A [Alkalihalophilus marmarensis]